MGKIFTWDAVQNGHIPRLKDFTLMIEEMQEALAKKDSIVGAIVCGSVTRGDHNLRSDIDCFVLYDHEWTADAFLFMQRATFVASHRHVPLSFIPCDTLLAGTRMHHIGSSFRRHLQQSVLAGGLLKGDPLGSVQCSVSEREDLESYLRVKMHNLQESWSKAKTFSEERLADYLQKLLEAPMHVARKTLAHQGLLEGDAKSHICSRYKECMSSTLSEHFERLVALDVSYTDELVRQLDDPNEAKYKQLLQSIAACSEDVLKFIRANLAFIAATAR